MTPTARASTLTVHCAPSFAAKWLGPRLASFIALHPDIVIRLSTGTGSYDLLKQETMDVAIVYGDVQVGAGILTEMLGEESIAAVCAPALAAGLSQDLRQAMKAAPLIESSVSPVRWPDWFAADGMGQRAPTPATSFDRGTLAVSAAAQGLGVALETERFLEAELASGQRVMLGEFWPIRRVLHRLLTRTGAHLPHRVRVATSWLLREVG